MKQISSPKRVSTDFAKLLDEIRKTRIDIGIDTLKNLKSDWRITLAMYRHPLMLKIKEDIINSDLK